MSNAVTSLRISLIVGTCVWLLGCSGLTRSEFSEPQLALPEQWQDQPAVSASGVLANDHWWEKFDNAQLNHLIEQVLVSNNDLNLASLTLRQARLEAGLAEDELYPQLSSSVGAGRNKVLSDGEASSSYSASLSVSYQVDLWGKLAADLDQAKWLAIASAEDRESTAQSLVATTATLYWQLAYLNQRVDLSENSVADGKQTLALTQAQYRSGAVTILNVLEAKRSLASLQASHSDWLQQRHEVQNALAILFNQPPQDFSLDVQGLSELPLPTVAAGIPADLLARRPDIRSALFELQAAQAHQDASKASYFPSLSLTGAVGGSSEQLKDLLRDPLASLGAEILLPFLQWNKLELNQQIADVGFQSALINYRQVLYQALQDVDNALSARQQYLYQGQRLAEQYQAAQQAERIYQSQYSNGAVGIKDWLDAQEERRNAQASLLENRYKQYATQATLYLALGGSDMAPSLE